MTYITFQNAIFAQNITLISELRRFGCIYIFFMLAEMLCEVHKELVNAARRETCSVLRARGYNAMSTLSFTEIIKEIQALQSHSIQFPLSVGWVGEDRGNKVGHITCP